MNDLTLKLPAIAPRRCMSAVVGGVQMCDAVDADCGAGGTRSRPLPRGNRGIDKEATSDRAMVMGGEP